MTLWRWQAYTSAGFEFCWHREFRLFQCECRPAFIGRSVAASTIPIAGSHKSSNFIAAGCERKSQWVARAGSRWVASANLFDAKLTAEAPFLLERSGVNRAHIEITKRAFYICRCTSGLRNNPCGITGIGPVSVRRKFIAVGEVCCFVRVTRRKE